MNRAVRALSWTVPALFCLWLYWFGLLAWFQRDDFAWLSLHNQVFDRHSFLTQMFSPMAQGTIRPWSERGFFLLFYRFFGADALPYRILVFATQFLNLLLLGWIVLRLTGSRIASFAAPVLWTANAALATAMSWTSDYNEILCAFCLLLAFALHLRGHYWLQLVVFVLGFGALELNVVYPALLLTYLAACRRPRSELLRTAPLFVISAVYYLVHRWAAPLPATGAYAWHLNFDIFRTFATYWSWAWIPATWRRSPRTILTLAYTALAVWHLVRQARRRNFLPLFFLLWFVITLAPLLPLRGHMTDYYLTIPAIGLAMLFGEMLTGRFGPYMLLPAAGYLFLQIPAARRQTQWSFDRSQDVREMVLGIRHAHELHPRKAILLTGVTQELYDFAMAHSPFQALDIPDVYLAEDSARNDFDRVLPAGVAARAVLDNELVMYSLTNGRPRNVTYQYEWNAAAVSDKDVPRTVDAGSRFMQYLLGSTWYPLEVDHRWMPQRASFRIGGPKTPNDRLILTGYCPEEQIGSVPLVLRVSVNGNPLPEVEFSKPEAPFTRSFRLPPDLTGSGSLEVSLWVNRTFAASAGGRPLGLAFGTFEIR